MPAIPCSAEGCTYVTDDFEVAAAVEQLKIHANDKHRAPTPTPPPQAPAPAAATGDVRQKPPKLNRPTISRGTTEEEWSIIKRKWAIYKTTMNIPNDQIATQLWQCCDDDLTSDLFRDIPNIASIAEDDLLAAIKFLAVVSVATTVRQTELLSPMHSLSDFLLPK